MTFVCDQCGKEFEAYVARFKGKKHKYCSLKCCGLAAKAKPNTECTICKTPMHLKPSQLQKRKWGTTCSKECRLKLRVLNTSEEANHQYGLRGSLNSSFKYQVRLVKNHNRYYYQVWMPEHPNSNSSSRVLLHRLVVEENHNLFDPKYFYDSEFGKILYKHYDVHHKDKNTLNNSIENLEILTRSEHSSLHSRGKIHKRNHKNGQIIGIVKSRELLENPEEDNQQPIVVNDIKVATQVQRLGGEESTNNPPTSARQESLIYKYSNDKLT